MNLMDTGMPALPVRSASLAATQPGIRVADLAALLKPRITLMVLLTVAIGFASGSAAGVNGSLLLHALLGIGLVAAGASVLNQYLERDTDALMKRTRRRPLPAGRMDAETALALGWVLGGLGLIYLSLTSNLLTVGLAAFTLVGYVYFYTPLKRVTPWNTFVGAVPGALPPVLGYAAATGTVDAVAGLLFGILFLWQFPHFWAIAWLYRDDYAAGGMMMLPAVDREGGRLTGRMMVKSALLLLVVSLLPTVLRMAGPLFFVTALLAGLAFVWACVSFWRRPADASARQAMLVSLIYLPLVLLAFLLDGPARLLG